MSDKPGNLNIHELLGIVHCYECKHFENRGSLAPRLGICTVTCKRNGFQFDFRDMWDGFCYWGEKR